MPSGGNSITTVTLYNTGSVASSLDDITVSLPSTPATPIYNTGSSTYNGVAISDPVISSNNVVFVGNWTIPASGSSTLQFALNYPGTPQGNYTSTIDGHVGSFTIGTSTSSSTPASITVTVGLPPAPTASNQNYTMTANTALNESTPGLLSGATGTSPSAYLSANPSHGTVTVNTDGSFTYTPNSTYAGMDSFTYENTDIVGQKSNIATVTIIISTPAAPVVNSENYTTAFDTTLITNTSNGTQANATGTGPLQTIVITNPLHGTLIMNNNGTFTYIPDNGYTGADSFTFQLEDSYGQYSNIANVVININKPPAPKANNNNYTTETNTTLSIASTNGILANSTGTGTLSAKLVSSTINGTITFNTDGSFIYVPNVGYSGYDTFTYEVADSFGQVSNLATATIQVKPSVQNQTYTTPFNTTLTLNANSGLLLDSSGNGLTVISATNPNHGTVTYNSDGSFIYTPFNNYAGNDSFTYTAKDLSEQTVTGNVMITVGLPVAPTVMNNTYTININTALNIGTPGVLAGSTGFIDNIEVNTLPQHGTVILNSDGSFQYTPNIGYSGKDYFTYIATNSYGQNVIGTINFVIRPEVFNKNITSYSGNTVTVIPQAPVGQGPFIFYLENNVNNTNGKISMNANTGAITFIPNPGFSGIVNVQYYTIGEDGVASSPATISFNVLGISTSVPDTGQGNGMFTELIFGFLFLVAGVTLFFKKRTKKGFEEYSR